MLQQDPFYYGSIRNLLVAFGAIFKDIVIIRRDKQGVPAQVIPIPLSYGPKEKYLYRAKQDPKVGQDDPLQMVLPRMSYEITGFTYDDSRKLPSTGRTVKVIQLDNKLMRAQYNPVPYNVGFNLNIMVKNVEDGLMIIEQILPFFTPDYTITIKDLPEMNLIKDIPVVLTGVANEDNWDGAWEERRSITWTLTFNVKGYLYPPVKPITKILTSDISFTADGEVPQEIARAESYPYGNNPNNSSREYIIHIDKKGQSQRETAPVTLSESHVVVKRDANGNIVP